MMKKTLQILLFLTITCIVANGQNYSKEFGKIGKETIDLKEYAPDKDAEALVLFDIAKSHFVRDEGSFKIIFERTTRIKILSEAGIKWAEVEIPFYHEGSIFEKVYDVEAYSYNLENNQLSRTPLDITNLYDEKINNYWNVKKFAMPNVKVGSTIEFRYKIESQYLFNLRDWEFQWRIPVVYSEYEVNMIPFYEYTFLLQGANNFDSHKTFEKRGLSRQFGSVNYHDMVHKYIMKDVPSFKSEDFITSYNDYIIKLDFQLARINYPDGRKIDIMTTWDKMIEEFLKHNDFGKYIKKSKKLSSKLISSEINDLKTEKEKFNYALDYVKNNFNWNNYYGKYATKSPNKLVEEKYGNCADINLFTIGLLNSLGIEAHPVLISTRQNGRIKYDYPYTNSFNYVIIMANVDNEKILSDATDVFCLNNRIPSRCINDKGFIIKENFTDWVGLKSNIFSRIETNITINITVDEIINSKIIKTSTEYDALEFRNLNGDKEDIIEKLNTNRYNIIDSSIEIQNQLKKEEPYLLSYELTSTPEFINDKIYLNPFLNEIISDNPLKQKERTYPVDMVFPKQRNFSTIINIPDGYTVDYTPTDQKIKNQLFELIYTTVTENNVMKIKFEYSFIKSVYSPKEYSKIKYYFNEIVKKGNDKIVFTKI